ncbi:hypothetical protein [Paenibacillus lactis]|uniref:DUF2489 domain-containing protein n=1 Tax=Paenibacillus lactis TaxID=228574 RepID=A0ABS4F9R8_9BACL|nr:hypothetical protein [Paenibacillus lactis]MBP1893000.1 hypothetical protein [Paenibacillus lactis]
MNDAILGALVSGLVGVAGVLIGGTLTYKLSHRSEKILIRKKVVIEKIQETQHGLYTIAKGLGTLLVSVTRCENQKISKEELLRISDQIQEDGGAITRSIRVNEVFLKKYSPLINDFIDQTAVFHELIYYVYIDPDHPGKWNYTPEELSYTHIESLIMQAVNSAMKIKEELDRQIEIELK